MTALLEKYVHAYIYIHTYIRMYIHTAIHMDLTAILGSLGISITSTALAAADLPFPFDLPDAGLLAAAAYGNAY